MPQNPHDLPSLTEFADAGKDKFSEQLYARKFLRKVKVRTHGRDWFVYDGKAWEPVDSSHYEPLALAVLPDRFKTSDHANKVMAFVRMHQQIAKGEEFYGAICFEDETEARVLVNCGNGMLAVSADGVALREHDEERLFTGHLNAEWPGKPFERAHAPLFMKLLDEVLPDPEDRALLQWFAGYLLFPAHIHEVFLISHGTGGTGKSSVSDTIMHTIGGTPLRTALSMAQICAEGQGAYSLPGLKHALVNMGTELDTVDIADSANFKRLVSGEPIEVRSIYARPYAMEGYTIKLWFNSNSLPRFRNGSDAELRRARFLEFLHKAAVKDEHLKEKLRGECDAVLAWMVEGLQAILQGAKPPEGSAASRRVKAKFAVSNDAVAAFAEEYLEFGSSFSVKKDDLFNEFGSFLSSWQFAEKSKQHLFRLFYDRYPEVSAYRDKHGVRDETCAQWVIGVRLKKQPEPVEEPEEYLESGDVP